MCLIFVSFRHTEGYPLVVEEIKPGGFNIDPQPGLPRSPLVLEPEAAGFGLRPG